MNQHDAQRHVKQLKDFYGNLFNYAKVLAIVFMIDLLTGGSWWFYWFAVFGGIALLIQAIRTFDIFPPLDKDWEERKIRELMDDQPKRKRKNDTPSDDYFENDVI